VTIVLENVAKAYRGKAVVAGICLTVNRGETYGLLGPNGAGKTTILRMVLGTEVPDAGEIRVFGERPRRSGWLTRRRIGVVSEHQTLYPHMTPREYLAYFGELYRADRLKAQVDDVIERLGMNSFADRRIAVLSFGMRQKVNLARALVHGPDLLILDEPISGLDPGNIRDVRDLLLQEKREGTTLLMSSHILSEVERTSDRVGILHNGRIFAEGPATALAVAFGEGEELRIELQREVQQEWLQAVSQIGDVRQARAIGSTITCRLPSGKDLRAAISQALTQHGATIVGFESRHMTLEETYLTITTRALDGIFAERAKHAVAKPVAENECSDCSR